MCESLDAQSVWTDPASRGHQRIAYLRKWNYATGGGEPKLIFDASASEISFIPKLIWTFRGQRVLQRLQYIG